MKLITFNQDHHFQLKRKISRITIHAVPATPSFTSKGTELNHNKNGGFGELLVLESDALSTWDGLASGLSMAADLD